MACTFSALSYAELASSIPVSGSAYTYTYATLGELVAWIIGWDLILEYGVSVAAHRGRLGRQPQRVPGRGVRLSTLPDAIAKSPSEGGVFNLPAVFIVLAITLLLVRGVTESARVNLVMVVIKLVILVFFIVVAFAELQHRPLHPVRPGRRPTGSPRGGDHLLRLHRVRRGLHRQRGGPTTRPATCPGDHRLAADLHGVLRADRGRRARHRLPRRRSKGSDAPLATALDKGAGIALGRRRSSRSARSSRSPAWCW